MGDIDLRKADAEAFRNFVRDLEVTFDYDGYFRIRVYETTDRGPRETVRVAGGELLADEAQFTAIMQILGREIFHEFLRRKGRF